MGIILVPLDIKYDYHIFPFRVILAESDCNQKPFFLLEIRNVVFYFRKRTWILYSGIEIDMYMIKIQNFAKSLCFICSKGSDFGILPLTLKSICVDFKFTRKRDFKQLIAFFKNILNLFVTIRHGGVQIFQYHFISLSLLSGHCRCYGNSCSCCHQSFLLFLLSSPRFLMFLFIVVVIR